MKKLQAKRFLLYFLFLSSLLSVLGCSDEDYGHSVPAGSRELTLFYQQQADVEVITRGTQTDDEIKIGNLYSIFYTYDDTDESKRTFAGVSVNELNSKSKSGTITIQMPEGLSALDKFYVYFLANPEGYVDLNGYVDVKHWLEAELSGTTYSEAADLVEGVAPDSPITTAPGLPMFGKATKDSKTSTIGAIFTRTVSRIDLYIDQTKLSHDDFELEAVMIRNARGYTKLLSGSSEDLRYESFKQYKEEIKFFTPETVAGVDQIVGEMYTFPNYQPVSSKGDEVTTCLIIKGKYNKGITSSYYRLNVKPTDGSQNLKPNYLYKIRITGVTGAGAENEDGAYQESDGKLSYEIDDWKPGDMGNGASDKYGNKLDVSPRQVVFSYLQGQTTTVNILKTLKDPDHNPGGVTVTSSDPTNFKATLNGDGTELEIAVLTANYGSTDREAHVMVEWGTMEVPVYITQSPEGGGSGGATKFTVELFEWNDRTDTGYPAANVTAGYTNHGAWGENTEKFKGFPSDKIGSHHLHFNIVEHKAIKYRITMPTTQGWNIIVTDEVAEYIDFTATTSATVGSDNFVWLMARKDIVAPWVGGSFVIVYDDGTWDKFYVHQSGVVSCMKHSYATGFDGKIFYYETMIINGEVWLDRNLGATSNGYYSNFEGTGIANDEGAQGTWFATANLATKACPAGFRLPGINGVGLTEMRYVFNNMDYANYLGIQYAGKTYKFTYYLTIDSTPTYWFIPICGCGSDPKTKSGMYWAQNGDSMYLGKSASDQPSSSVVNTAGAAGSDSDAGEYEALSARCIRK